MWVTVGLPLSFAEKNHKILIECLFESFELSYLKSIRLV